MNWLGLCVTLCNLLFAWMCLIWLKKVVKHMCKNNHKSWTCIFKRRAFKINISSRLYYQQKRVREQEQHTEIERCRKEKKKRKEIKRNSHEDKPRFKLLFPLWIPSYSSIKHTLSQYDLKSHRNCVKLNAGTLHIKGISLSAAVVACVRLIHLCSRYFPVWFYAYFDRTNLIISFFSDIEVKKSQMNNEIKIEGKDVAIIEIG